MAPLSLDELRTSVEAGETDTVLLCLADMQGRLQGKRLTARHFLEEVLGHGAEACNYLLAVDVEMNTVDGYAMSSWERGYGDFELKPDLETLRWVPWHPGTALCMADLQWADGSPVVASPRQILRAQLERLEERGMQAVGATELEFQVFRDSYDEAAAKGWINLRPANLYNVDYSMLGTARVEPLLRRIRNGMAGAGLRVENSKGECNLGQHEINFAYGPVLQTADEHTIYKNGAKEIADQEGMAISFMAKYDEREGNSCHIHLSLRRDDGSAVFEDDDAAFDRFLAGQLACLRELCYLFAPNVNSYKRFAEGSFAPTAVAWGHDNRTCALRVVGHGPSKRIELRLPGADVNPYLALSAIIAAGLHGIDEGLELEPAVRGQRVHVGQAARAGHAAGGPRHVRGGLGRPRRVRRRGRRPLPQRGRRGARRLRGHRHRLGARPRLRTAVTSAATVFAPVRSQTAFEETMERLGTAIKLGLLQPGDRLPAERDLCRQLGISRSTLRQALTALVQSGHLRATRGRSGGTFVAERLPPAPTPSPALLAGWRDACDQRLAVELAVAALAAERAEPAALDPLDALVGEMDLALDDFAAYRRADVRWHIGLAEAAGSPRLIAAMTEAQGAMSDLIAQSPTRRSCWPGPTSSTRSWCSPRGQETATGR